MSPLTLVNTDDGESGKVDALIRLVGARGRATRTGQGLSRRQVAEQSGVSLRYLAQLESGAGNISIGLLKRVALALNTPIEALIAVEDPQTAELANVARLYAQADTATKSQIMKILDPGRQHAEKAKRICLIGLRGAGKSSLGTLIAQDFDMPFVELNAEIEDFAGIPITEIIALYGEKGYRQFESDALGRIAAKHSRIIVAVAGGVVESPKTFEQVLAWFHTVWIKALPSEHMERVRAQGDLRPMAGNPQAMIQLRQILKQRELKYARSDFQLDTSGKDLSSAHADLRNLILNQEIVGDY